MSDWQVGDLALCVDDSPCRCCGEASPTAIHGHVYTVVGLKFWEGGLYLVLDDVPTAPDHDEGEIASRFRKILPDKHDACEPEFVTLLKRTKRTVSA